MNTRFATLIEDAESRYLTEGEQQEFLHYAQSLPSRFQASAAIEAAESAIIEESVSQIRKDYPNMEKFHYSGWDKAKRDMQLVLRHCTVAMITDDLAGLDDRLLYWLRTILASVNLTPKFVHDSYGYMRSACQANLPEDAFALLEPALQRTIDVLSDFPEPHSPAV